MGAADPTKDSIMATDRDDPNSSPRTPHPRPITSSPSCSSMATVPSRTSPIRGRCPRPTQSPAPSPTSSTPSSATLTDTRLEPDLEDLLWSTVNLFHRAVDRIERELDDNEQAQQRSQREQNGSEVRSVELERLVAEGLTLIERRNAIELFRDQAAERFEVHTGSAWRPRTGSMVNHRDPDRRDDRQPRVPRRPAPGRDRSAAAGRTEDRLHRRRSTSTTIG